MTNTSNDTTPLPLSLSNEVSEKDKIFLSQYYQLTSNSEWYLDTTNDCYRINNPAEKLSLTLDFREGNYRHRNQNIGKEPLLQAVKIKGKLPQTLIDTTPGVMKDSIMLASRGIKITAIERHPLLFVIVRQALSFLDLDIDYHFGDSSILLPEFSAQVIYLDPMYPSKKKSAQVKKDMQILHSLVGKDDDAEKLLQVARQQQARVIVKRPSYAEYLGNQTPNFSSQAQKRGATRFDIYL